MTSVLYIGNKLSQSGYTPTAIEVLGPLLESEGVTVKYASSKKNKFYRLCEMLWLTYKLRKEIHYVLIDTYSTSNFWYAFSVSQLCRIFKRKYIPILHGGGLPNRLLKNPTLSRMIFQNSLTNVAPSGYLYERFQKAGFKVDYIPNPVELGAFPFAERINIRPKLLWVRSLAPIYNPSLILRVGAILKPEFPELEIMMVGPDKSGMLPELQRKAHELALDVIFTGKLDKKEWAQKAIEYDIFVNTTHVDNAPYSLIEAASLGLPIVSTNVGGISYIFDDKKTALLVEDDDADGMATAIRLLITDKKLAQDLIANSQILSQEFGWDRVKYKWLQILR